AACGQRRSDGRGAQGAELSHGYRANPAIRHPYSYLAAPSRARRNPERAGDLGGLPLPRLASHPPRLVDRCSRNTLFSTRSIGRSIGRRNRKSELQRVRLSSPFRSSGTRRFATPITTARSFLADS